MRYSKIFILAGLALAIWIIPTKVLADVFTENNRDNQATDFQPTTSNPQNDVGTGLQQNIGDLQPTANTTTGSQATLPNVGDLQVLGINGQPNRRQTQPEVVKSIKKRSVWPFVLIGAVALAIGLFLLAKLNLRKTQPQLPQIAPESDALEITESPKPKPKRKPKPSPKKKSKKRKKSKK